MEDIQKVKAEIVEHMGGIEPPRICGFLIALKIFYEEKKGEIVLSESSQKHEKYSSIVGRVVGVGPEAYPADRNPSGPRCKLGDWVTFKAASGQRLVYRGHIMEYVSDDNITSVIDDPTYVTRC